MTDESKAPKSTAQKSKAQKQVPATGQVLPDLEPGQTGAVKQPEAPTANRVLREILGGNAVVSVLAGTGPTQGGSARVRVASNARTDSSCASENPLPTRPA